MPTGKPEPTTLDSWLAVNHSRPAPKPKPRRWRDSFYEHAPELLMLAVLAVVLVVSSVVR